MRFFTQELLDRFGTADDDIADAANEEWEQKCAEYNAHLQSIWKQLPAHARSLIERALARCSCGGHRKCS